MSKDNRSILSGYIYQRHLENAIADIITLADKVECFKIGKTGMAIEDRFAEPDYNGVYDDIDEVYSSTDSEKVSQMEADLIEEFKDYFNCDNKRTTDKDEMADSDEYHVYVVWK